MDLKDFQTQFKDLMLDHPDALDAPPADLAAFCDTKAGGGVIDLPTRLKVYRNNIVGSLTDLMMASFPVIERLVGREFLEGMARGFILENPPTQGCLSWYGEGFDDFIKGFKPAAALPYLADVARYEIAVNQAYYAADDAALRGEDLAAVVAENLGGLRLGLRDSVQIVRSDYPLIGLQDFDGEGDAPDMDMGGVWMVCRPVLDSVTVELAVDEALMLEGLAAGQSLGEAVETVLGAYPDFDFQGFLQKHLALETFLALGVNV